MLIDAVVRRDFVVPVVVELAANAADNAVCIASQLVVAIAQVGDGRILAELEVRIVRRDAVIVRDQVASLVGQERIVDVRGLTKKRARCIAAAEEEWTGVEAARFLVDIFGFNKGFERIRDGVMAEDVDAVAIVRR